LTRGLNGSEPLDLDPTARERPAARAAAGGAGGEVGAAALRRRRAITRSRPWFHVRLGREASSRHGGSNWGTWKGRGQPWTAAGDERRSGPLGIVVRAWGGRKGEKNRQRASLPPRETSGALGCRRGAARRRRGKLSSQVAMAVAARVLGF
jgi:hypothetical protein